MPKNITTMLTSHAQGSEKVQPLTLKVNSPAPLMRPFFAVIASANEKILLTRFHYSITKLFKKLPADKVIPVRPGRQFTRGYVRGIGRH